MELGAVASVGVSHDIVVANALAHPVAGPIEQIGETVRVEILVNENGNPGRSLVAPSPESRRDGVRTGPNARPLGSPMILVGGRVSPYPVRQVGRRVVTIQPTHLGRITRVQQD